jgi:hypothetical protein
MEVAWGDLSIDKSEFIRRIHLKLDFVRDTMEKDDAAFLKDAEKQRSWDPLEFMMRLVEFSAEPPKFTCPTCSGTSVVL